MTEAEVLDYNVRWYIQWCKLHVQTNL